MKDSTRHSEVEKRHGSGFNNKRKANSRKTNKYQTNKQDSNTLIEDEVNMSLEINLLKKQNEDNQKKLEANKEILEEQKKVIEQLTQELRHNTLVKELNVKIRRLTSSWTNSKEKLAVALKEIESLKKENLKLKEELYNAYGKEETILKIYKTLYERYQALSKSRLGKLQLKYWQSRKR